MLKIPLFTQHSRSWRENRFVYPVISRRSRGLSIGVNLNPDTVCNFDCVYCCVDRTAPPPPTALRPRVDLAVLREELAHMLQLATTGELFAHPPFDATPPPLRRLNDVAFSGDGEPTSYEHFTDVCRLTADLLADLPDVRIVVITNATLFHRPAVREALAFLDAHRGELWAKLDAGTEPYYQLVERTTIPLARVLDNLLDAGRARPIVIQSLFMNLHGVGPDDAEIDAYIARLRDLQAGGCRIARVQVYTVARRTAEDFVTPLPDARVDAIAARVAALGLAAEAYYGPT